MQHASLQFTLAGSRLVVALVLASALVIAPAPAFAAAPPAHKDRAELRIQDMHGKLKITEAEEVQWSAVAQVMRENAKIMDTLTQSRQDHAKDATAVDDLKSYGEIAEAHAEGLRKLTPVFATLYAGMSDAQKLQADGLFRHGERKHMRKHANKAAPAK